MASFNMIVVEVAVVILIIALALVGWGIYDMEHGSQVKYPPVEGSCPDFWNAEVSNGVMKCNNTLKVGNSTKSMCQGFNQQSVASDCEKWTLSNMCGITWDGITDNNDLQATCSGQQPPSDNSSSVCPSECDTNSATNASSL